MHMPSGFDENRQIVAGRNAVMEALRSGRTIDCVYLQKGDRHGQIIKILAICKDRGIIVKEAAREKLNQLSGSANHQGIAAVLSAYPYLQLDELLQIAKRKNQPPFLVLCDEIADPHNLGAIIRTAEAAGAHGVVIPKRRAVGLTGTVVKAASGALEYLPVAKVSNMVDAIESLKKENIFVFGADMAGKPYRKVDYTIGTALVIGSEGAGIRRLVKEKCDDTIALPMYGKVESLNASVACGILLYEVAYQRNKG